MQRVDKYEQHREEFYQNNPQNNPEFDRDEF